MGDKIYLVHDWVKNNPQQDLSFFCDVLYSLFMFDATPKSSIKYINTWFESKMFSKWIFNRRMGRYELKTESELCEIRLGTHGKDRQNERIQDLMIEKIKPIVLRRLHKEGIHDNEILFLIVETEEGSSQGYVISVRCEDVLIKHIKIITIIGNQKKYFSKDRMIKIKVKKM